jgi:hypothetical protein
VSGPVARSQPTDETNDALRSLLDDHLLVVAEFEAREAQAKQALEAEQAKRALEAERAKQALEAEQAKPALQPSEDAEADDDETLDPQLAELLEQLIAAEQRAESAEQQVALAQQQLAAQAARALAQSSATPDETAPSRGSSAALWGGWALAAIAVAVSAGFYVTSHRPLREQLAAQTKTMALQASRSSATEAALRQGFDQEREALNEQLNAARASAVAAAANSAAAAAKAVDASDSAADSGERVTKNAAKLEARAAKREARLAKNAARNAEHESRVAKRKGHGARKGGGDADESLASKPKHSAKPAAHDTYDASGGNDPLEGL